MRKRPDVGARPARGSIRVSAGEWRGRRLEIPPGARPTSARAREALLDILQPRIAEAHVLDLYSGSGAVGLEAVSRGAARAVLVEQDAGVLERNVSRLAAGRERVEVLGLPAESALALLDRRGERFGIVFADPPYGSGLPEEVGRGVGRLLSPDGIFVLQADRGAKEPRLAGLGRVDRRDYGRNLFIFYGLSVGSF
jgi:16S rRNA (guanine(966)-N(2))-methyltransferase RsmD